MEEEVINMDNRLDVYMDKVREFRAAYGFVSPRFFEDSDSDNTKVQARLILEEWQEYEQANTRRDVIDALGDLMYVTIGAVLAAGIRISSPVLPLCVHKCDGFTKIAMVNHVTRAITECNKYQLCKKGLIRGLSELYIRIEQAAIASGIDLPRAFDRIHTSNMGKLWTWDETKGLDNQHIVTMTDTKSERKYRVKNKDGKLIKPPSFQPPYLDDL